MILYSIYLTHRDNFCRGLYVSKLRYLVVPIIKADNFTISGIESN